MEQPLLSIVTITYNHEPFIAKTIEGVLMQQVNFPIEFIIAEDCSTDGTRRICQDYADKYPDLIRLIISDTNVGAVANERRAFEAARGKYIATCEGDDYWTDPMKLQKQVDFLEAHHDYSVTFHRYSIMQVNNQSVQDDGCDFLFENKNINGVEISMHQFLHRWVTQYLTMVFRKDCFDTRLVEKYKLFRDTHLMYHLIEKGRCYLFAFNGGVYFQTHKGEFSHRSQFEASEMTLKVDTEIWKVTGDKRMKEMCEIVIQYMIDAFSKERKYRLPLCKYASRLFWYTGNLRKYCKNIVRIVR